MRILITNDDGIDTAGIRLLAENAKKYGEVWVVAPDGQRSAMSHCYSFRETITVRDFDFGMEGITAYTCTGTPADCVRVGATRLMPQRPDFVLSGINNGYNMCWDIQYSATIGAAMEAVSMGIQAIAFSEGSQDKNEVTRVYLDEILRECMSKPLGVNQAWNVNFPDSGLDGLSGIKRDCKVSTDQFYDDFYDEEMLEDGGIKLKVVPKRIWKATEGTDLDAIMKNYISIGVVNNIG